MKKNIVIICLLLLSTNIKAQSNDETKFRTFFDYGYFDSSFRLASDGGNYLSAGFGYKINKEFWLNINFIKISSSGEFEPNPLFVDNKTAYNSTMIVPNFSKEWKISKKIFISGSIGGALIFEKALEPLIITNNGNNVIGIELSNKGETFDIGLFAELILKYEITRNFNFTINTKTYVPLYLEPDSYMIGAGLEIKL